MLNIGPGELLAICAIALIVLGPDKLPQALRTMGRVTAELRRVSTGFQDEIRHAMDDALRQDDDEDDMVGSRGRTPRVDTEQGDLSPDAETSAVDVDLDEDDMDTEADATESSGSSKSNGSSGGHSTTAEP